MSADATVVGALVADPFTGIVVPFVSLVGDGPEHCLDIVPSPLVIESAANQLCDECAAGDAFMVAPEQAALVTHIPLRMIYRWIETALVHFRETANGSVIVCLKSLTITRNQIDE